MPYPKDKKIFTDVIGKIKDKYQKKQANISLFKMDMTVYLSM